MTVKRIRRSTTTIPKLQAAPLIQAPQNELGVVFLFSQLQKKYGVRVDTIQPGFPDCIARRIRGRKDQTIRIEFEYKSANFKTHKHTPNNCDWIVCWEHNWPGVPPHLQVIELRAAFGLGWSVWLNPMDVKWYKGYAGRTIEPTIPRRAKKGDLILTYFRKPKSEIAFVHRITSLKRDAHGRRAGHSGKRDWWAVAAKVCALDCPLKLEKMKSRKELCTAGFIRGSCQGRQDVTIFWPELYHLIIRLNPQMKKFLAKYAPERMDGSILAA